MSITAIIVNFNGGEVLGECISALMSGSVVPRILLADNASTDGSFERLQSLYGHTQDVEFLSNPSNLGFARAVNNLARQAQADFLLVLNPDCMLERYTLERLRDALLADSDAGLSGPCVRGANGDVQRGTYRQFPGPWNSLMTFTGLAWLGAWFPALAGVEVPKRRWPEAANDSKAVEADAVSGACMLIRRSALEEIGYFDESYGLHCEDIDLMFRLRKAGWRRLFVPAATATHIQGVSSRSRPFWVHRQKHLGMLRFFNKFQAAQTAWPLRWLVYAGIWLKYFLTWPLVLLKR